MTPIVENTYKEICARAKDDITVELPAERVLANELGVSRGTLRSALAEVENDGRLLPKRGRLRFLKPKKQFSKKHLQIGFLLGRMCVHFLEYEIRQWLKLLERDQHHPMILSMSTLSDVNYEALETLPYPIHNLDGVIAIDIWYKAGIRWLESLSCPVISIDHPTSSRHIIDFMPDERRSCQKIARYFKKHKINTVHYYDFESPWINPLRWEAFAAAMVGEDIHIKGRYFIPFHPTNMDAAIENHINCLSPHEGIFSVMHDAGKLIDTKILKLTEAISKTCHMVTASAMPFKSLSGIKCVTYYRDSERAAGKAYDLLMKAIMDPKASRRKHHFPININYS